MSSAHGSDSNAGCPSACVMIVSSVRVCDCVGVTTSRTGITLIDGIIPMLDVSQPSWAAQLYTATTIYHNNWIIDFQFPVSIILRQVDLYLFFCPFQNIPNEGLLFIQIYQSILFPNRNKGLLLGNITITGEEQNCTDLIWKSVPTIPSALSQYLIEFSMDNILGRIYIGEVTFRDEIAVATSSKL